MISIRTIYSTYVFRYEGNIKVDIDDFPFVTITADKFLVDKDGLPRVSSLTIDKFWIQDIESIKGE